MSADIAGAMNVLIRIFYGSADNVMSTISYPEAALKNSQPTQSMIPPTNAIGVSLA